MTSLKKSLGQHLLVSQGALEKIARTLAPTKDDVVLEIGPGTGNLTKHIAKYASRVIAVEKDLAMVEKLKTQSEKLKNLYILHADFLKLDLTQTLKHLNTQTLFCGNIPYNISSPILFKLRENKNLFKRGIITIQREVANRLIARPGSKDYGVLSILMQSDSTIKKVFDINPGSFFPPPKVDSTVVEIKFPNPPPYKVNDRLTFEKIVKASFSKRRKMIRNNLPKEYLAFLEKAGIRPIDRAEDITINQFIKLADAVTKTP